MDRGRPSTPHFYAVSAPYAYCSPYMTITDMTGMRFNKIEGKNECVTPPVPKAATLAPDLRRFVLPQLSTPVNTGGFMPPSAAAQYHNQMLKMQRDGTPMKPILRISQMEALSPYLDPAATSSALATTLPNPTAASPHPVATWLDHDITNADALLDLAAKELLQPAAKDDPAISSVLVGEDKSGSGKADSAGTRDSPIDLGPDKADLGKIVVPIDSDIYSAALPTTSICISGERCRK